MFHAFRLPTNLFRRLDLIRITGGVWRGVLALGIGLAVGSAAFAANQPPQPKSGPGGADYIEGEVIKRAVGSFETPTLVFHAGTASAPRPVVIFLHAQGADNPAYYGGWIEHLARKGHLVVWPRFQVTNRVRIQDGMANMLAALKESLPALAADGEARADLTRIAVVGHVAGAPMAMNLAALAAENGLPAPRLVMALTPGGTVANARERGIALADVARIPPETMILTLIGDRDHLPSERQARQFLREASAVPASRKLYMRFQSDDHGFPPMTATLAAPAAPREAYDIARIKLPPEPPRDPKAPRRQAWRWSADMALSGPQSVLVAQMGNNTIDALDYMAFWRVLDMAMTAAFAGQDAAALAANPALTDMGRWSNGWPVKRLSATILRDAPANPAPAPGGGAAGTAPRRP